VPVFGRASDGSVGGGAQHAASLRSPTDVVGLVQQAVREAEKARCRTVIVDTAGRLQIDAELMDELKALRAATSPREVLLVADGMTGQDAVRTARGFQEGVGLPGANLTKLEGDRRGGTAPSVPGVSGMQTIFRAHERPGVRGGQVRRKASEGRRGHRAVHDARRAGRSVDPQRIAAAADREGRGADRTGSQPAAGAVPADAEAFEKDVGTLWQLAF